MTLDKDQLITKIRSNIGSPSVSDISSDQIGSAVDSAVREYSKYKPKTVYATFDTEANVAEITLSEVIGSAVINVIDCMWDPIGTYFDKDLVSTIPDDFSYNSLAGISVFHNPSIVLQLQQKMESFRERFGGDWDYYDGKLRLLPSPTSSGKKVGLIASCVKGLDEIPDIDEDDLLLWAEAQAGKILLEKMTRISSVNMEGSSISFNTTEARKSIDNKENKFKKRFGGYVGTFSTG